MLIKYIILEECCEMINDYFRENVLYNLKILKTPPNISFLDLLKYIEKLANEYNIKFNSDQLKIKSLKTITDFLTTDLDAAYITDKASKSKKEIVYTYPGFYVTILYRFANLLYKQKVEILPRLISEYAHSKSGIDIHPGATIGKSFFIDHGTGVVIGETSIIGDNVTIYHGVTLGDFGSKKNTLSKKRHPTIMNGVTIYSNSTILGGDTVIGVNTIIGANSLVTKNISPNSIVFQERKIITKQRVYS